jgi:hypothetical protein
MRIVIRASARPRFNWCALGDVSVKPREKTTAARKTSFNAILLNLQQHSHRSNPAKPSSGAQKLAERQESHTAQAKM